MGAEQQGAIPQHYSYSVDGDRYSSANQHTTGAIIKSKLPESKRGYSLYLESGSGAPDILVNDDTSVDLGDVQQKQFYTVPPASFGAP